MRAQEGYLMSKGIKKSDDPGLYPDDAGRKALKARLEREKQ
jgi:hypothetical protein